MKEYTFFQTFAIAGGTSADVIDGLMAHATDYQGRHRPVQDLAVHQMAEHIAVSGSVSAAHVAAGLSVFVDFTVDFLNHCSGAEGRAQQLVFMPVEVTIDYEGAPVAA